mgnify:CR=1 FL=1
MKLNPRELEVLKILHENDRAEYVLPYYKTVCGESESVPARGTDGQGVTTLVGAYGCPLQCRYCLNPHAWNPTTLERCA